jgi:hypothetical protein
VAQPCHGIGIAGSSPAMTARECSSPERAQLGEIADCYLFVAARR